MLGKLLVIEGIDASGKGTQAKLLYERLIKENYNAELVSFPKYNSWSSIFVKKYLNGELGNLEELSANQCSLFYALDRFVHSKEMYNFLKEGKVIVCDRYTGSNKGHQTSKIKNFEERLNFLRWNNELEYDLLKLPKEDINIYLDMPAEWSQKLVLSKEKRNYTKKNKDLHEQDLEHLINTRKAYLDILNHENNWVKIDCVENNELLSIENIHKKIWKVVNKVLNK